MLNSLIQHEPCVITTTTGESVTGVYGGVETQHGEWSVLVTQGLHTVSVPLESVQAASTAAWS